jgi:Fe2+ or Zn2+ uptake regulation protein
MPAYTSISLKAELNARGWRLTAQREKIIHVFQNLNIITSASIGFIRWRMI